jgi:dTDP-4-amino-4,6-dideoxygalactose transaminase
VREGAPFNRRELTGHLDRAKIASRTLFGGNLTRQPAYRDVPFRVTGELIETDRIMQRAFWLGIYPGITEPMIDYVAEVMAGVCGGASRID